jgi:methylmalonyl-CoA/ethylmalonyl-CoA epimerase
MSSSPSDTAHLEAIGGELRLGRIHHVALVVAEMEPAIRLYHDTLGLPLEGISAIESDAVRIAFLTAGQSKIELVEPTDDRSGVARFLSTRGEGFHHVCFEVADLASSLERLGREGLELIDRQARRGAEGPVAFIHPRSCHGVLVELIEAPDGPAWSALGFET